MKSASRYLLLLCIGFTTLSAFADIKRRPDDQATMYEVNNNDGQAKQTSNGMAVTNKRLEKTGKTLSMGGIFSLFDSDKPMTPRMGKVAVKPVDKQTVQAEATPIQKSEEKTDDSSMMDTFLGFFKGDPEKQQRMGGGK